MGPSCELFGQAFLALAFFELIRLYRDAPPKPPMPEIKEITPIVEKKEEVIIQNSQPMKTYIDKKWGDYP